MKTAMCKLIEYSGVTYLIFDETKELQRGDRVLTPMRYPLGTVLGAAGGWDMDGLYSISIASGIVTLLGRALNVVVALEGEIAKDDLMQLKQNTTCSVVIENGKPFFLEGKVKIIF